MDNTFAPPTLLRQPECYNARTDPFAFRVRNALGGEANGTATIRVFVPEGGGQTLNVSGLSATATNTVVRFAGIPGRQYRVQVTTNLLEPWQNVGNITMGGLGYVVFTNEGTPPASQYYRTARPE